MGFHNRTSKKILRTSGTTHLLETISKKYFDIVQQTTEEGSRSYPTKKPAKCNVITESITAPNSLESIALA